MDHLTYVPLGEDVSAQRWRNTWEDTRYLVVYYARLVTCLLRGRRDVR